MSAGSSELDDGLAHDADWIDAVIVALVIGIWIGWLLGRIPA